MQNDTVSDTWGIGPMAAIHEWPAYHGWSDNLMSRGAQAEIHELPVLNVQCIVGHLILCMLLATVPCSPVLCATVL